MSLFIEVYVGNKENKKLVADCHAYNISNLADVSDYEFISSQKAVPHLNIPYKEFKGSIKKHNRNQSVWSLVEKIARESNESN